MGIWSDLCGTILGKYLFRDQLNVDDVRALAMVSMGPGRLGLLVVCLVHSFWTCASKSNSAETLEDICKLEVVRYSVNLTKICCNGW